jgi:hypothetical protein
MTRDVIIPQILNEKKLSVGVEIGGFKGEFSKTILSKWGGKLYIVDVWGKIDDYDDKNNHEYGKGIYNECIINTSEYVDRSFMLRMSSEEASKLFNDDSLDYIYIDANHSYDGLVLDLNLWYPKIKKGGLISGHDYLLTNWYNGDFLKNEKDKFINFNGEYLGVFGVNSAIDEFTRKHNINFNLTAELFSTWYFIKNG